MDDAKAVMMAVGVIIALMLLASITGNSAKVRDDGAAINISSKDIPKMPEIKLPNASIDVPFVEKHEITGGISIDDVKFATLDGVGIAGTTYIPANSKPKSVAVLVHQLGASRKTYDTLARQLASSGIAVIAIDLRGHGGSPYKGGYSSFSTEDWLSSKKDIDGALGALYDRAGDGKLPASLVGASIGANLALQYAAEGKKPIAKVVLLSPGLDFRGVPSEEAVVKYGGGVLAIASDEDLYSFDSVQKLQVGNTAIEVVNYSGLGHGTEMLSDGQARQKIVEWLVEE